MRSSTNYVRLSHFTGKTTIIYLLLFLIGLNGYLLLVTARYSRTITQYQDLIEALNQDKTTLESRLAGRSQQRARTTQFQDWPTRKTMSLTHKGKEYSAYWLVPSYTIDWSIQPFVIANDQEEPLFVSNFLVSGEFQSDKLFAFAGENIYIVNTQHESIDSYYLGPTLRYVASIPLPDAAIGELYGVTCEENECTAHTAFHQESGCEVRLDLASNSYTSFSCRSHDGSIISPKYGEF